MTPRQPSQRQPNPVPPPPPPDIPLSIPQRRIFDFTLPLPSVIVGAITIASFMVWLGGQAATNTNKLDALLVTQTKIEKRLDDRDARLENMRETMTTLQRGLDKADLRLTALERDKK